MWTWLVGKIIQPFLPYILAGLLALGIAGSVYSFYKGYQYASGLCESERLAAEVKAKDAVIEKYKNLIAAAEKQRVEEAQASLDREAAIKARMAELEVENQKAQEDQQSIETDLTAAVQDKEKLNALIAKLRTTIRTDCRASDADVRLDGRLRGPR